MYWNIFLPKTVWSNHQHYIVSINKPSVCKGVVIGGSLIVCRNKSRIKQPHSLKRRFPGNEAKDQSHCFYKCFHRDVKNVWETGYNVCYNDNYSQASCQSKITTLVFGDLQPRPLFYLSNTLSHMSNSQAHASSQEGSLVDTCSLYQERTFCVAQLCKNRTRISQDTHILCVCLNVQLY